MWSVNFRVSEVFGAPVPGGSGLLVDIPGDAERAPCPEIGGIRQSSDGPSLATGFRFGGEEGMFTATLLVAQVFLITPSRPPLSPAEAVTVLRSGDSDRNVTDVLLNATQEAPRAFVVPSPRRILRPTLLRAYPPTTRSVHVARGPYVPYPFLPRTGPASNRRFLRGER